MSKKKGFWSAAFSDWKFWVCLFFDVLDFVLSTIILIFDSATFIGVYDFIQVVFFFIMFSVVGMPQVYSLLSENVVDLFPGGQWVTGWIPTYTIIYLFALESGRIK